MCRFIAILLTLSTCALAQFFGLATPGDGSRLYFATPLRQKNTTQPDYGKLFRIDASGLNVQESRPYQAPPPLPTGVDIGQFSLSNAYSLFAADVSADGQVIAAMASRECIGDLAICARLDLNFVTTITASGESHDYFDVLRLSANGKWAFGGTGARPDSGIWGYLVNVITGEQTVLRPGSPAVSRFQVASNGRPIANDGTAVFSDEGAVVVLQGSQTRRIPTQSQYDWPADAVIDEAAHTIVYSVIAAIAVGPGGICICGAQSLRMADAVTGESTLLVPDGYAPSMTDDGQMVLYLSSRSGTPQAWLIHIDGSGDRELTNDPLGLTRAILSGDGRTAYAVTLGGQLLKIAVASGEIEELIPRTPYFDGNQVTAPGKLTTFTGVGLSDLALNAAPPLPYTLDNVKVTIQGKPTRILGIRPTSLTVLTPPDVTPTLFTIPPVDDEHWLVMNEPPVSLQFDAISASPFAGGAVPVRIQSSFPEFLWQSGLYMLAAHEDWSDLVTALNPAHPGEVVHAYAAGLGATSPAVPYGAPAPAQEPLARLIAGYQCRSANTNEDVEVLFQGLAPNLAGIYQIDWRIPLNLAAGDRDPATGQPLFVIFCQIPNQGPFSIFAGRISVAP